jgi:hypothetical protein
MLQKSFSELSFGLTVLMIIVGVIGVIGNISIISTYFFRIKDRGERYFIPLLAIVDLLACVTILPYIVIEYTSRFDYPSDFACRLFCMLRLFLSGISAFLFLLISVQRYLLVCKPFGPKMTLFWKRFSFTLACGIAIVVLAPILGISGVRSSEKLYMNTNITVNECKFSAHPSVGAVVYFGIMILVILCCVIATITLYIPVLKQVKNSVRFFRSKISNTEYKNENLTMKEMKSLTISRFKEREMKSMEASEDSDIPLRIPKASQSQSVQTDASYIENVCEDHPSHSTVPGEQTCVKDTSKNHTSGRKPRRKLVQRRLTMMFFFLIVFYLISYIPPLVILIVTYTIKDFSFITLSRTKAQIWIYVSQMALLNHVINPFIYGYYDIQFREQLISCFKRLVRIH